MSNNHEGQSVVVDNVEKRIVHKDKEIDTFEMYDNKLSTDKLTRLTFRQTTDENIFRLLLLTFISGKQNSPSFIINIHYNFILSIIITINTKKTQ